jgi:hypothetical protein
MHQTERSPSAIATSTKLSWASPAPSTTRPRPATSAGLFAGAQGGSSIIWLYRVSIRLAKKPSRWLSVPARSSAFGLGALRGSNYRFWPPFFITIFRGAQWSAGHTVRAISTVVITHGDDYIRQLLVASRTRCTGSQVDQSGIPDLVTLFLRMGSTGSTINGHCPVRSRELTNSCSKLVVN